MADSRRVKVAQLFRSYCPDLRSEDLVIMTAPLIVDNSRWQRTHSFLRMMVPMVTYILIPLATTGPQSEGEAREIMRRVITQARAEDEVADVAMRLIDSKGRIRQRTATVYSKRASAQSDMRLIRFFTPPDLADSGVLTLEHDDRDADQWLYLPAYHTSRRIASANRSDTYMGTDFSYEDITGPKIDHYQYRIVGKEILRATQCTVIETIPAETRLKKESGYQKMMYWIDPDKAMTLKVDYYNRSGTLLKTMENSNLERAGNYYRWRKTEMHDLKRDHRTVLDFSNRRINQALSAQYFTIRYLERGS